MPRSDLELSYSRSSGPGGQNVNKRSTKAEVRFSLVKAVWLPDEVKDAFRQLHASYIVSQDTVILTCQKHRTQPENERSCLKRLQEFVDDACLSASGLATRDERKTSRIQKSKAKARSRALKKVKSAAEGGGTEQAEAGFST